MEDNTKKIVMIVVTVACLLLAGTVLLRSCSTGGAGIDTEQLGKQKLWILCANCHHTFQWTKNELNEWMSEHDDMFPSVTSGNPGIKCPECGKQACFFGYKCPECGTFYFPGQIKGEYRDTCPKCRYSKMKEIGKKYQD